MRADNKPKPLALASPQEIPAHCAEQITIPSPTGSCSPPFAAMQRREESNRTCLILSKMITPLTFRKMSQEHTVRTAAKY